MDAQQIFLDDGQRRFAEETSDYDFMLPNIELLVHKYHKEFDLYASLKLLILVNYSPFLCS